MTHGGEEAKGRWQERDRGKLEVASARIFGHGRSLLDVFCFSDLIIAQMFAFDNYEFGEFGGLGSG